MLQDKKLHEESRQEYSEEVFGDEAPGWCSPEFSGGCILNEDDE